MKNFLYILFIFVIINTTNAESLLVQADAGYGYFVYITVKAPRTSNYGSYEMSGHGGTGIDRRIGTYYYDAVIHNGAYKGGFFEMRTPEIYNNCSGSFSVDNSNIRGVFLKFNRENCSVYVSYDSNRKIKSMTEYVYDDCLKNSEFTENLCIGAYYADVKKDIQKAKEYFHKGCNNREAITCNWLAKKHSNNSLEKFDYYLKACNYDMGLVAFYNATGTVNTYGCDELFPIMTDEIEKFKSGKSNNLRAMHNKLCVAKNRKAYEVDVVCTQLSNFLNGR